MSPKSQVRPVEVKFRKRGYALLESHHDENFLMDWRRDSFPKILMFVGGEGVLELDRGSFAIQAPMVCVIPKSERHRIVDTSGRPLSLYGICLRSSAFPSRDLLQSSCSEFQIENEFRRIQRIENWLRQLLAEERLQQPNFDDAQLCLITWILLELARAPKSETIRTTDSKYRVERYVASLEKEFWRNEAIDTVARTLGLSRRRFTQLFREISGESWQRRVMILRMNYAADLLRNTGLSVRSIAFECGYRDLTHFYRVFKQAQGKSPGQYRLDR
jgi:AraC-like DNA-binding protein